MTTTAQLVKSSVTVTLGLKQYEIQQLKWGKEKEWRLMATNYLNRLPLYAEILSSLTSEELLTNQIAIRETSPAKDDKPAKTMEVNLSKFMQQAIISVTQYPETAYELLLAYAPELNTPEVQNDVNEHGTSGQVVAAFLEVLNMAYPFFGQLTGLLKVGRKPPAISTS